MLDLGRDGAYLWDMLETARKLRSTIKGLSRDQYLNDHMRQDAVERQLEVLGEAARHVSSATRDQLPEIPWRRLIGLRNIIAHQYREVDHAILWTIATVHLPPLITTLEPLVPPPAEL